MTADFSQDNGWAILGKAVFIFAFLVLNVLIAIWAERRIIGRSSRRSSRRKSIRSAHTPREPGEDPS